MARPAYATGWVTFLSDYGLDDLFVGVCKGVMARVANAVRVLDVCHQVNAQDVEQAAFTLSAAVPFLPAGVHLALVDPAREQAPRPVAVATADGSVLVGPDNGVLSLAWTALGGAESAYELTNAERWLQTPHRAFRGRDIFAPVAAHLAVGAALDEVGTPVALEGLTSTRIRSATIDDDHVHAEVVSVDHFGNLSLNVQRGDLEAAGIVLGDRAEVRSESRSAIVPFTLGTGDVEPGRLVLCEDSFRAVMLSVNLGHAAEVLRLRRGDALVIGRVPQG